MSAAQPQPIVIQEPLDAAAAARSQAYGRFALVLAYPAGETLTALLDGSLLEEMREIARDLPYPLPVPQTLELPTGDQPRTALQICHTSLFDVCTGKPAVSLLERRYGDRKLPEQKLWEDLLRFYAFFGLDFSGDGIQEQPDHLLTELEFMHYLCFLQAGMQRSRDDLLRGQRDFLTQHLAPLGGAFAEAMRSEQDTGPYRGITDLLDRLVAAETAYLAEEID